MYKMGKVFIVAALFVVASASADASQGGSAGAQNESTGYLSKAYDACTNNCVAAFIAKYLWNLGCDADALAKAGGWKLWALNGYKYVVVPVTVAGTVYYVWTKVYGEAQEENGDARFNTMIRY